MTIINSQTWYDFLKSCQVRRQRKPCFAPRSTKPKTKRSVLVEDNNQNVLFFAIN
jgi:hypothetical protein